jgi:dihydrofolate synthase / folylpolyglutamate synthase
VSQPASLPAWLAYLETLHPKTIALGLDRVGAVYARMAVRITCPVITVAGTNGKGSTCAYLDHMLRCAGYRVGLYTSPHLLRYNERVRIQGEAGSDESLCEGFAAVEAVRGDTSLTQFEFYTLAALWLFSRADLDAIVLEVGLGGRLDAVNVVDADVAVVTTVDIDHVGYLGGTREEIGREKAGIFRAGRLAVCGDRNPPASLLQRASAIGARLLRMGIEYGYTALAGQWSYWGPGGARHGLPHPALRGPYQLANAATAITALDALRARLPVAMGAIRDALVGIELPGRFQVLAGRPVTVLDVAHNPQAARALADNLGGMGFHPETVAVFAIMADKDIDAVIAALTPRIDRWHIASLAPPRGASATLVHDRLRAAGVDAAVIRDFVDVAEAYLAAREAVSDADRIVVFGSFLTVAAVLAATQSRVS